MVQRGELAACKTLASRQARVVRDDHQSLAIRSSINYFALNNRVQALRPKQAVSG